MRLEERLGVGVLQCFAGGYSRSKRVNLGLTTVTPVCLSMGGVLGTLGWQQKLKKSYPAVLITGFGTFIKTGNSFKITPQRETNLALGVVRGVIYSAAIFIGTANTSHLECEET